MRPRVPRMGTCNIRRHQGKDSKGGRKSVPPFPTRSAAPAPEQRSPPTVQTTSGAGWNEEGLPGRERPATRPAPPSLPPVQTLGKLRAPPLPVVRGRICTSRSPAPRKPRQEAPPPPPPSSLPARTPGVKGVGKREGERGRSAKDTAPVHPKG